MARCVGVENAVCTQLGPLGRPGFVAQTCRLTYTLSEASVSLSGAGIVVINTSTTTVGGTGSDGSTFKIHFTVYTNVPPTGTINEFFRCH